MDDLPTDITQSSRDTPFSRCASTDEDKSQYGQGILPGRLQIAKNHKSSSNYKTQHTKSKIKSHCLDFIIPFSFLFHNFLTEIDKTSSALAPLRQGGTNGYTSASPIPTPKPILWMAAPSPAPNAIPTDKSMPEFGDFLTESSFHCSCFFLFHFVSHMQLLQ